MRRTIIYLQNLVLRYYTYLYKDFVYLKASEVGMTLIEFDPQGDIFKIINDFKNRLKLQEYIDDATKDMMIEIFYEFDGNYSTKRSFYQIFGGVNFLLFRFLNLILRK